MKFAYYNEFDPKAAAWIKQLIKNGMIADGEVDERSITEVTADEIRGFTQHHFFAGIGGWSYSLRLAGWADDRPVCTASLPCQPFSVAGAQKGVDDDRHLLPHFIELVKQCNFQTIFGEQVPGAIKHGWLDDLCIEMEREKYAVGQIVIPAAAYGAFHIRQRLYWVAEKCVVPYNIKTVQHNEKDNDHEEMQQVRGSEASNRIQEQSTGKRQADVFLHRMWEEKDAGIPQEKQNVAQCKSAGEAQGKPDTRSEIQGESQREVPLVGVDTGDKKTISSNGERVRFGKPCGRYKRKSIPDDMRTDRNTTCRRGSRETKLQYAINGSSRFNQRLHIRQHTNSMLGNKRSNGAVGRRYFTWNNQVVDGKGKGINDPTSKFNSRSLKKFGLKQLAYIQLKGCYKKDSERVGYYSCIGEGAPHIRQRLYWVADSINKGSQGRLSGWQDQEREIVSGHAGCSGTVGGLSDTENGYGGGEPQLATSNVGESWDQSGGNGACGGLVYTDGARPQQGRESTEATGHRNTIESTSGIDGLANTFDIINERKIGGIHAEKNSSQTLNGENINKPRESIRAGSNDGWSNPDWLYCRDEKYRPIRHGINPLARTVKSSSFKMANGLPRGVGYSSDPSEPIDPDNTQEARVMRLKGYGNAIVPQVAASFIKAFMEAT